MEVFLLFPKSLQAKKELSDQLAKFQANQALQYIQKLPCCTEQKLELIDTVARDLNSQT